MIHRFGEFELDTSSLTLRAPGGTVDLPRKVVETLAVLVSHGGAVVTKKTLMDALWPDVFVEEANLSQNVYLLRRAFRQYGVQNAIRTHARRGYSFCLPVMPSMRRVPDRVRAFRLAAAAAALCVVAASSVSASAPLPAQAAQTYTIGRYFWNLRSVEGMSRSVGYFRRVIDEAPDRALGYAALADAYTELADFEQPCAQCTTWERLAEKAANRAIALEPSSPDALVAQAMVARIFHGDDATAGREFRAAIALDPKNSLAHQWLGNMLVARGAITEGREQLEIAAELQPTSTATYAWLARANYYARRYAEAEHDARLALAFEPTRLETNVLLGEIEQARGAYGDALHQFETVSRLGARVEAVVLQSSVYAAMGRRVRALTELQSVAKAASLDPYASRDMVLVYEEAGDVPAARAQLNRAHFSNRLDRELFALDPRNRDLRTAILAVHV